MATKDIAVNGQVFPCPLSWTVEQATNAIRSRYVLQGGGIEEDGVPTLGGATIRNLAGPLTFVGGQPIQQLGANAASASVPSVISTSVQFDNQPQYTDGASKYVVHNTAMVWTSNTIELYMRTEAKRLWKALADKANQPFIAIINGCPGVGKSVVVFAFAVSHCQARGKSLLYYHHDASDSTWFSMNRDGVVSTIDLTAGADDAERTKVLLQMRASHDMTVIDGTHEEALLNSLYHKFPKDKSLIFCTSYQAFNWNQEADFQFHQKGGLKLSVASWSLSEYLEATDANCLLADVKRKERRRLEAERRYQVAGGSVRLFVLGVDGAANFLTRKIGSVSNYEDLFRNNVGPKSKDAVNSLTALYRATGDDSDAELKAVPLSKFVLAALAQLCKAEEDAFKFITDARRALPDNPSWQGWVTEVEVLTIMRVRQQLSVYWTMDAKTRSQQTQKTTFRCAAFSELKRQETYPHWDKRVVNHLVVPRLWNQPLWYAVHYLPLKALGVWQITNAHSHVNKFAHLEQLVTTTGASRVKFFTICPKDVYSYHQSENRDAASIAQKLGILIETNVVWYEGLSATAEGAGRDEQPSKKRRLSS